jgi:hypothetical protein
MEKNMKKATVVLLLLALAMPAFAAEKSKESQGLDRDGITQLVRTVVAEVEPNDVFTAGSGPLVGGDQGTGGISASTDVDFWVLNVTVLGAWTINTDAGAAPALVDSKMYLYGSDGTTQLAYDDDSGPGFYSQFTYNFTATGTYYLKVIGYSASYTGNYVLNVGSPVPPPANDTCAGAIAIPFVSGFSVATTTTGANSDYTLLSTGCTGYAAAGPDIVYTVTMAAEQEITLEWLPVTFDASLYVVTDCADPMGTCVAGADLAGSGAAETVSFQNTTTGTVTYFIICDAYGSGSGPATLTIQAAVATEASSWGSVKAMYH